MSKKIISFVLAVLILASLCITAFADDSDVNSDAALQKNVGYRDDGLPDIDPYKWPFMLANSYNSIGLYNYAGVNISYLYSSGIDSRILDDAVAFIEATRQAGYEVYVNRGHMSWEYYLCGHYQSLIEQKYGDAYHAALNELPPGCDDHQTSISFDICVDSRYQGDYASVDPSAKESEAFDYMSKHCAEYGFIVRYPEDKSDYYGVACPGAHFRYVGVEAATYIMENNLCLEEFLLLYGYPVNLGTAVKDGAGEKDNY